MAQKQTNKPAIYIGCWYGPDSVSAGQPAAFICLPPALDGEPIEAVLEVYKDSLDDIAPNDEELHEFILKWEHYALENHLSFETSEDFEVVDNRWRVVVEEE